MSKSRRQQKLDTLKRLYGHRESAAAVEFAEANRAFSREHTQLTNIENLVESYSQNYEAQKASQATAGELKRWQRFVNNLQGVADKQARRVQKVQQHQQQKKNTWLKSHRDIRGVEKLQEKLASQAEQQLRKTERELLDEMGRRNTR